jgi:hypothetical protein
MIILQEFLKTCMEHSINFVPPDMQEQIFDSQQGKIKYQ